jgi:membrane dipeptidase
LVLSFGAQTEEAADMQISVSSGVCLLASLAVGFGGAARAADVPVKPDVRALHERLLVLDTHFDSAANLARAGWDVMQRHTYAEDFTQVDLPRLVEGGYDGGFWTLYTAQGPRTAAGHAAARDSAIQIAVRIHKMVAARPEKFEIALRADDAARIAAAGKHAVYLSIENGYPLGHDLTLVKTFYDLGVRMLSTVHSGNNELADSSTDTKGAEWQGLSPLGKQVVAECNRLGIVVDASHASDAVLAQLMELSTTPILLSHSSLKAVFDHPRNIPDDLLRKLAAKGGVIQLNAFSPYVAAFPQSPERNAAQREMFSRLGGSSRLGTPEGFAAYLAMRREFDRKFPRQLAPFDAFIAHVLHALKVVGPDHVGISGDFDGGGGVEGFDDVTGAPRITAAILAAGYTEADLGKIWSGNVLRLLRAAEAGADKSPAKP